MGSDSLTLTDRPSSLSQILQGEIITNVVTTRELLRLRACSKSLSEVLRQESLFRGSEVDLQNAGAQAFRSGSAFSCFMAVLAQAKVIKLQYRHILGVPQASTSRVVLDWSGQMFLRRETNSWNALHPVSQSASLDVDSVLVQHTVHQPSTKLKSSLWILNDGERSWTLQKNRGGGGG